jgi:hypothetical protein
VRVAVGQLPDIVGEIVADGRTALRSPGVDVTLPQAREGEAVISPCSKFSPATEAAERVECLCISRIIVQINSGQIRQGGLSEDREDGSVPMSGESTKLPIVIQREVRRNDALRPAGAAGDAIAFLARIDRAHVLPCRSGRTRRQDLAGAERIGRLRAAGTARTELRGSG